VKANIRFEHQLLAVEAERREAEALGRSSLSNRRWISSRTRYCSTGCKRAGGSEASTSIGRLSGAALGLGVANVQNHKKCEWVKENRPAVLWLLSPQRSDVLMVRHAATGGFRLVHASERRLKSRR
jgi:hypothetical protein